MCSNCEAPGRAAAKARREREAAARKYRPKSVRVLFIAQAPPASKPADPPRYFFFEEVAKHDDLFRGVVRSVFGSNPQRNQKPLFLAKLRDLGFFLIDVKPDPIGVGPPLEHCVNCVVRRAEELAPRCVILIKADVFDVAFEPLQRAGLPVVAERLPFPGSGRQAEFDRGCRRALAACPDLER